ncbi:MAG: GUN4 domain-containing protein [Phormidesmis sp.]
MSNDAVTVFFSYSHKDKTLRDELAKHLQALKLSDVIADWHDGEILPGDEWNREIQKNLNSAQIILLLISSDFIGSRYCRDIEIKRAMERHEAGEARVIPIILRRCFWRVTPFGKLQALPKNGTPVMDAGNWPTWDDAFFSITEGIYKVANSFSQHGMEKPVQAVIAETPPLLEDSTGNTQAQYRAQVREYLVDHQLTVFHQVRLDLLRKQLKLAASEAQRIVAEELAPLEQNRESYREALSQFVEAGHNPQDDEVQKALRQIRLDLQLTDSEATEIEQPILTAAEYKFEILGSERGIDYSRLRNILESKDWQAADEETYEVMIRAVGKESGNYFSADELLNFPGGDLLIIDRLWVKYSQGQFGFSVQKEIYVECGGKLDGIYPGDEIWEAFSEKVGWRTKGSWISYSNVTFDKSAPKGHLPIHLPSWLESRGIFSWQSGDYALFFLAFSY